MATKFLKSPNGGIYKDSNGKLVGVEPERVIRDIDGSIPASTLEDISVSTGTASTNGVTYIRATMKGEVTYTDNTHDTINYYIDLPIKAGAGVTIEAQPIEGGTGNKQLVISASGGGGATLNKYTASVTSADLLINILTQAKGNVVIYDGAVPGPMSYDMRKNIYMAMSGFSCYSSNMQFRFVELNRETKSIISDYRCSITSNGATFSTGNNDLLLTITYYNDTEITA